MILKICIEILLPSFGLTLIISLVLVWTKAVHGRFSNDIALGIQKSHTQPTPRIGGISLVAGFTTLLVTLGSELRDLVIIIGIGGLPAFFLGWRTILQSQFR